MSKISKNLNKNYQYYNGGEPDGFRQLNLFGDERFKGETERKKGVDIQKILIKIWQEVLGRQEIDVNDNFFEIGGDSLLINKIHFRLKKIYPNIKIAELFSYSTIADLASYLSNTRQQQPIRGVAKNKISDKANDIAITGIALKTSFSMNLAEFWSNLEDGRDGLREIPPIRERDLGRYPDAMKAIDRAGYLEEIDKFDYSYFRISPKEASLMDPNQRLFLQTVYEAIDDAGEGGRLKRTNTGLYLGFLTDNAYRRLISEMEPRSLPQSVTGNTESLISGRISYLLDLKGPSMIVNTSCSSSLVALHLACKSIQRGECDQAIAGGLKLNIIPLSGQANIGIESKDGHTRTFDDKADGTNRSEAVAAVFLKPLSRALEDKDHIYAVIKGSAINQDGAGVGLSAPNAAAQTEVIEAAWQDAGVDPKTISYIEAHGTGTKLGDPIEIEGITKAFKKYTAETNFCHIGSVKSNLGHTVEASGLVGLIKTALALKHKQIPPSIHFQEPNRKIDWDKASVMVATKLIPWTRIDENTPLRAGVSSFGISGTNCHVVLEEAPPTPRLRRAGPATASGAASPHLLLLSAKTETALRSLVNNYFSFISKEENEDVSLADVSYTAACGRSHHEHRLAIIALDKKDLKGKLSALNKVHPDNWNKTGDKAIRYDWYRALSPTAKRENRHDFSPKEERTLTRTANQTITDIKTKQVTIPALHKLARLYVSGANPDWDAFYQNKEVRKISLPTYPFERTRCWVEIPETKHYFHHLIWQKEPLPAAIDTRSRPTGNTLFFHSGDDLGARLKEHYGGRVIEIMPCNKYGKKNDDQYTITSSQKDYDQLISHIGSAPITRVIHAFSLKPRPINTIRDLKDSQDQRVMSLFYLAKSLQKHQAANNHIDMILLSRHADIVTDQDKEVRPENAALIGLGKAISLENPNLKCRSLDIDDKTDTKNIITEINSPYSAYKVAYRDNERYAEVLDELDLNTLPEKKTEIKEGNVYLISGGTGGLGLAMAKYLSQQAKVKLALLSRNPRKLPILKEIEKTGSEVLILSADVADEKQLSRAIATIRKKYKKINGIIHAAGVAGDGFIIRKDETTFKNVLAPKITGTWMLNRLTEKDKLDFFISFSSTAAIFSTPGQGDYTAANAYLDAFAKNQRAGTKCRTLSINWSAWQEIGMAVDKRTDTARDAVRPLTIARAMAAFTSLLARDMDRASIMVGEINYDNLSNRYRRHALLIDLSPALEKKTAERPAQPNLSNALPAPLITPPVLKGKKEGKDYTDMEKKIAAIWQEVLGYKEIDVNDNFFEIGGDSLMIIRVQAIIKAKLNIEVPITILFNRATVRALAGYLSKQKSLSHVSIKPVSEKEMYDPSHAQMRIWIMDKIVSNFPLYNLGFINEITGNLELAVLEKALQILIDRHEALRTGFVELNNGRPMQIIKKDVKANLKIIDLSAANKDAAATTEEGAIEQIVNAKFDLSKDELWRTTLIRSKQKKWLFIIVVHHIIADLRSLQIFFSELNSLYYSCLRDQPNSLPPLSIQYKDYAEYEKSPEYAVKLRDQEKYWLKQLGGELPVLDLPTDKPRPAVQTYDSHTESLVISRELTAKLRELANKNDVTLFVLLLAVFKVLLSRITGQEDIIVGTFATNRDQSELENILGIMVNSIALRTNLGNNPSFSELLSMVRKTVLDGMANKDYPFEYILEKINPVRDLSRPPVFSVVFQVFNKQKNREKGFYDLFLKRDAFDRTYGQYDINLRLYETVENDSQFVLGYSTSLFNPETSRRLLEHLRILCESVTANPDQKISALEIMTPEEKYKLIHELNDTKINYPKNKTLAELFEERVKKAPNNIAIKYEGQKLTYRELNEKANRLAHFLIKKHRVKPDDIVGIMVERSLEMIIGIIAILKAGGAYLPIDPEYPAERIIRLLNNCGAKTVLAGRIKKGNIKIIDISKTELFAGSSAANPENTVRSGDLAYLVYTSGSTGEPKGVAIEHRSVINFITGLTQKIDFSSGQKILASTNLTFDISVLETILPLTQGLSVILSSDEDRRDPSALLSLIKNNQIDIIQFTPSMARPLIERPDFGQCLRSVKSVILGGEQLSLRLLEELRELIKKTGSETRIYNAYGPTETTIWSTIKELTSESDITIGYPISNTETYVLDKNRKLLPLGFPGELYISGAGLARGYFNDPEKTKRLFLPHPFIKGERVYKTGDLARLRPDGNIEILGRIDHQIKLRGHRIEPGEIEADFQIIDGVKDCAVIGHKDALAAYYTTEGGKSIDIEMIRTRLKTGFPDYMVPTYLVHLKEFPLNASGKIDHKKLPVPGESDLLKRQYKAPRSAIEKELYGIWREVLSAESIGIQDNFFDVGGNSLMIVQIHQKLEKLYPGRINIAELFTYPTIVKLEEYLARADQEAKTPLAIMPLETRISSGTVNNDIAIIGISLKTSLAENAAEFWHNLKAGRDCVRELTGIRKGDADRYLDFKQARGKNGHRPIRHRYIQAGYLSEIDKFDHTYFKLSPKEASLMDPNQRLFLEAVYKAIDDAGQNKESLRNTKTGLYVAYSLVVC